MKIAITGATGQVGKELAFLLQKAEIANLLLVRNTAKAAFLQHKSSKIAAFDFTEPETHRDALEDVDQLFLVSDPSLAESSIRAFVNAAQKGGVKKIVVMSGMGAGKCKGHFLSKIERLVEDSQIPCILLRANWFFQNFASYFREMIVDEHELAFPDGRATISFVDARDIAEVALYFLTHSVEGQKSVYDITGPESLSHKAVAQLFSKHLPYKVGYQELSEQEAKDQLGWNDEWLNLFKDIRKGITAPVSASVKNILGRPARRLEDYIVENISVWR